MAELTQHDGIVDSITEDQGQNPEDACCPYREGLEMPMLFNNTGIAGASLFFSRVGRRTWQDAKRPRIEPYAHRVHSLELSPPLPLAEFLVDAAGPCKDNGLTQEWPQPASDSE